MRHSVLRFRTRDLPWGRQPGLMGLRVVRLFDGVICCVTPDRCLPFSVLHFSSLMSLVYSKHREAWN